MWQALLAIQNILQNSNIFNRSGEKVLFTPFDDKKVTQFSGFLPTSVSYLKVRPEWSDRVRRSCYLINLCRLKLKTSEHFKYVLFNYLGSLLTCSDMYTATPEVRAPIQSVQFALEIKT